MQIDVRLELIILNKKASAGAGERAAPRGARGWCVGGEGVPAPRRILGRPRSRCDASTRPSAAERRPSAAAGAASPWRSPPPGRRARRARPPLRRRRGRSPGGPGELHGGAHHRPRAHAPLRARRARGSRRRAAGLARDDVARPVLALEARLAAVERHVGPAVLLAHAGVVARRLLRRRARRAARMRRQLLGGEPGGSQRPPRVRRESERGGKRAHRGGRARERERASARVRALARGRT